MKHLFGIGVKLTIVRCLLPFVWVVRTSSVAFTVDEVVQLAVLLLVAWHLRVMRPLLVRATGFVSTRVGQAGVDGR